MEQAWSTKLEQTAGLSHPVFSSSSQFYLRNRKPAFLNSVCMIKGVSLQCRIPVTSIALRQTSKGNESRWKYVPKALKQNVEGPSRSDVDTINKDTVGGSLKVGKTEVTEEAWDEDTVDDSLNMKSTEPIEEVQTIIKKVSEKVNLAEDNSLQPLKWPLWFLGPSLLLATGAMPTLWLPFSSIFSGFNVAGLLALTGLDGIFNMGATFFLLMADCCARPKKGQISHLKIPFSYKFWNLVLNLSSAVNKRIEHGHRFKCTSVVNGRNKRSSGMVGACSWDATHENCMVRGSCTNQTGDLMSIMKGGAFILILQDVQAAGRVLQCMLVFLSDAVD